MILLAAWIENTDDGASAASLQLGPSWAEQQRRDAEKKRAYAQELLQQRYAKPDSLFWILPELGNFMLGIFTYLYVFGPSFKRAAVCVEAWKGPQRED
jgi:hypothetical protein